MSHRYCMRINTVLYMNFLQQLEFERILNIFNIRGRHHNRSREGDHVTSVWYEGIQHFSWIFRDCCKEASTTIDHQTRKRIVSHSYHMSESNINDWILRDCWIYYITEDGTIIKTGKRILSYLYQIIPLERIKLWWSDFIGEISIIFI